MEKKLELLAPAGSYESLTAAVNAGADAVYVGGSRFGARAYADNLDQEKLLDAIDYCHLHKRKLYLTVNTLLKEDELDGLYPYLLPFYEQGLDAVIVQDIGALKRIRECFPGLEIHASTQMTLTGPDGCRFIKDEGVKRVVTSRELSLDEIRQIRQETQVEIESFVHGALCYCYSGQCLFSSLIGGRSGNRGRCAQPCRLPYQIDDSKKAYYLSPKDMCALGLIPQMADAGVYSFKIEGRMKRPEYTAGVVEIYRRYMDFFLEKGDSGYRVREEDRLQLMDLYNRGGFSEGYYRVRNGRNMISLDQPNHYGTPGARMEQVKRDKAVLTALEELHDGDILIEPEIQVGGEHKKGERFTVDLKKAGVVSKGQVLRRVRNEALMSRIRECYLKDNLKEKINGNLMISPKNPAILELMAGDTKVCVSGSTVMEAKNQPLTAEKVQKQMEKTGESPFCFENLQISLKDGCFLPVQEQNSLRRKGIEALADKLLLPFRRHDAKPPCAAGAAEDGKSKTGKEESVEAESSIEKKGCMGKNNPPEIMVSLTDLSALEDLLGFKQVAGFYVDTEDENCIRRCRKAGKRCYYRLPRIFREDAREKSINGGLKRLEEFDGVLAANFEEAAFLLGNGYSKEIILDHNMYTFNREARTFWSEKGIARDTVPVELNRRELAARGCRGSELLVYGRIPVMVSAQCLFKTEGKCRKNSGICRLKDRKGKVFPVTADCRYCYNTIYNSAPLVLLDQAEEIAGLEPASIRLSFTVENREEAIRVVKEYIRAFCFHEKAQNPFTEFTKGHFTRGVE